MSTGTDPAGAPGRHAGDRRTDAGLSRPAWLLALVVTLFVSALVFLEYAQRPVVNLMTLAVPTLTALYVASRVEKRSDEQDQVLERHTEKLATVEKATNGDLTRRLNEAVSPIHEQLRMLSDALARNHPDDPLAQAVRESAGAMEDEPVKDAGDV